MMSSLPIHRTVADVMTTQVHVASPSTPFKVLVRMIEDNRISAVPIVDGQGVPIGIVSEADLLLKERRGELASGSGPVSRWRHREERAKAEGVVATELMTSPAITIRSDSKLARAAQLMQEKNVRRLVVVDDRGRIAGIVSRSDLLQVFLRTDEDIRSDVLRKVIPAILPDENYVVEVDVNSNVITLDGEVDRRSDAEILARMTREIDGVVNVISRLGYRWDDTKAHAPAR